MGGSGDIKLTKDGNTLLKEMVRCLLCLLLLLFYFYFSYSSYLGIVYFKIYVLSRVYLVVV